MKLYFGIDNQSLCHMLSVAMADRDWSTAKRILAVLRTRVSEGEFPDFPG